MESKSLFSPPFPKDRRPQPTRNSLCESASEQERNRALRGLPLWCYSERKPDYIWYVYGMNGCKHHVELISDMTEFCCILDPKTPQKSELTAHASNSDACWLGGIWVAHCSKSVRMHTLPSSCLHTPLPPRLSTPQSHRGINAYSRMLLLNRAYVTWQRAPSAAWETAGQAACLSLTSSSSAQSILFTSSVLTRRGEARQCTGGGGEGVGKNPKMFESPECGKARRGKKRGEEEEQRGRPTSSPTLTVLPNLFCGMFC